MEDTTTDEGARIPPHYYTNATSQIENASTVTQKSPFLDWPAELRSKIYFYALVSDKSIGIAKEAFLYDVQHKAPALLQTCRQVREDARSIYYSNNYFLAYGYYTWAIDFFAWLKNLEPKDAFSVKHYGAQSGRCSTTEATWQFRKLLHHFKLVDSASCDDAIVTMLISLFTKFYEDFEERGRCPRGMLGSDVLRWSELNGIIDDKHIPSHAL